MDKFLLLLGTVIIIGLIAIGANYQPQQQCVEKLLSPLDPNCVGGHIEIANERVICRCGSK